MIWGKLNPWTRRVFPKWLSKTWTPSKMMPCKRHLTLPLLGHWPLVIEPSVKFTPSFTPISKPTGLLHFVGNPPPKSAHEGHPFPRVASHYGRRSREATWLSGQTLSRVHKIANKYSNRSLWAGMVWSPQRPSPMSKPKGASHFIPCPKQTPPI
jgi:hypothetical protein